MTTDRRSSRWGMTARAVIWSIRHQDRLGRLVRRGVWSATAVVLLLCLGGGVTLDKALSILLLGAVAMGTAMWGFLAARRSWLLQIDDPILKEEMHRVMICYLSGKAAVRKPKRSGEATQQDPGGKCLHC